MKLRLLLLFCIAFTGLFAQPDTVGIKYLKYDGVRFYLGQKKILRNVLFTDAWAMGKMDINPTVADSLINFLLLRKNVVIELGGHSDCGANAEIQKKKSINAAQFVKKYLVDKGVPADHIKTHGYGHALPIEPCEGTENIHPANRRVEAKVVDFIKPKFTYADSILYSGQVMVFSHYSMLQQSNTITPPSTPAIDSLAQFLTQHDNVKIEIGVHSDTRGSDQANKDVTRFNAKYIQDILISKGIAQDRITAIGYGESVPLEPCPQKAECSEATHNKNRRLEIKILGTE